MKAFSLKVPLDFFHLFSFSPTFLLLVAWLNFLDMENIIPLALLACLCHEWGHYWAIRFFGGKVKSIHFTVIGAQMEVPQYFTYTQEFFSALAGPLVNLLFALALCHFFPLFAGLHLALGLLNLLPLSPLDGGRALSCLLALFLPLPWQQGIRYALHRLCALAVLAFGLWLFLEGGSITLFLLGIWLQSSHHADC